MATRNFIRLALCAALPLAGLAEAEAQTDPRDAEFKEAYSFYTGDNDNPKADSMFFELAKDGYAPAYPYAALAYYERKGDVVSFLEYGGMSITPDGNNWIARYMGDHYYKAGKYAEALRCYENGSTDKSGWQGYCIYKRGTMYEEGIGVERSLLKAIELYRQCADLGSHSKEEAIQKLRSLGVEYEE